MHIRSAVSFANLNVFPLGNARYDPDLVVDYVP